MVGEYKDDCMQGHRHFTGVVNNASGGDFGGSLMLGNRSPDQIDNIFTALGVAVVNAPNFGWGKARVGQNTHGKQKGVKYIVKVL